MKTLLKRILPRVFIRALRQLLELFMRNVQLTICRSGTLSSLYYLLFSRRFDREHKAVLAGQAAYSKKLMEIGESCALLRRNIHRLEKGLIMRPRKDVFAESYIEETVRCYELVFGVSTLARNEKKWATDVLDEYFNVVGTSSTIDKARTAYSLIRQAVGGGDLTNLFVPQHDGFKPYLYEQLPKSDITFEQLSQLVKQRRSVRWYTSKFVPFTLIQSAANLASFAPSACNRQSFRFLFCNNKDKAIAIAKCVAGTDGFAENLPAVIAIIGDLSAYPYEKDRHLIYIDASLAAMQLMLALETLGLSTCSINWPEEAACERKIRNLVDLSVYERVIMLLAVGYADSNGGIPYSQKKQDALILKNIS